MTANILTLDGIAPAVDPAAWVAQTATLSRCPELANSLIGRGFQAYAMAQLADWPSLRRMSTIGTSVSRSNRAAITRIRPGSGHMR